MSDKPPEKPSRHKPLPEKPPPIELEPLEVEPLPRDEPPGPKGRSYTFSEDQAIPALPLHLCPNCDYNLTGLIERRCPECGQSFSLAEARERGYSGGASPIREMIEQIEVAEFDLKVGVALTVVGFLLANYVSVSFGPFKVSYMRLGAITYAGLVHLILLGALLLPGLLWRAYHDIPWGSFWYAIGLMSLIGGLIITLL